VFTDSEDRQANRVVMLDGHPMRVLSLLNQAVFYSEVGIRPGQANIQMETSCNQKSTPVSIERVHEIVVRNRCLDNAEIKSFDSF